MGEYHIRGGLKLAGKIKTGGAKNAVLPILAASVLLDGKSVIHNAPGITDTFLTCEILRELGAAADFDNSVITVDPTGISSTVLPAAYVSEMRSSILFMGSMLGRFGKAAIAMPGGCKLGKRSVNYHLDAFRKMGADIELDEKEGVYNCVVKGKRLEGKVIKLRTPSVGATENIILAAVLADGETVIKNAAREPEIVNLAGFLNSAGAKISGAGFGTVGITGVKKLTGAEVKIIPDRIVAGTYLTAAAMTGGEVLLTNCVPKHLRAVYCRFIEAGCTVKKGGGFIFLKAPERLRSLKNLSTQPYPGFPTDMQAQFMAMLAVSEGKCAVRETIFEARDKHICSLIKMGADIKRNKDKKISLVAGSKELTAADVEAEDLRGGAALILAGLAARGVTVVKNSLHVERGYESIDADLRALGADIALKP